MNLTVVTSKSKHAYASTFLPKRIKYWSDAGCTVKLLERNHPHFFLKIEELDQQDDHVIFWRPLRENTERI